MVTETKDKTGSILQGGNPEDEIGAMFSVGAHYAQTRSRRHPSAKPYIFGVKNKIEIFDLEKVREQVLQAEMYVEELGRNNKVILWVGSKMEARKPILKVAELLDMPYVVSRWIGGTLTNFSQIRARVDTLIDLENKFEKGELSKYTKKERLLMHRDKEALQERFGGLKSLHSLPDAVFVVDAKEEDIAVKEALRLNIPIITVSCSDCDINKTDYPIPANDTSGRSVEYFVNRLAASYEAGHKDAKLSADK